MKKLKIHLLLLFFLPNLMAQDMTPSMQAWKDLLEKPGLAAYFDDIFKNLGIKVLDTQEAFTVHHQKYHFTLSEGIDEAKVDYILEIKSENIDNMAAHGADGEITPEESYKILSILFTPFTKASLAHPKMNKKFWLRMAGIEDLMHVKLLGPEDGTVYAHTLIFINKHWLVVEGLHGKAERTFNLTPEAALDYQKQVFKAVHNNNLKSWRQFKNWYKDWRKAVSETQKG